MINAEPLVSVIIPTYNRKTYVTKAIGSVLSQTYGNMEIVVIDDCSGDQTYEALLEISRKYSAIIPLRNERNLGAAGTANKGISKAQGKYIAMLDDDDVWHDPQKLEKQVRFLEENPDYVLTGGGLVKINENGKEIIRYLFPEKDEEIRRVLLVDNVFAHSTVVYRRAAFVQAGGYVPGFAFFADMDLWLKLGAIGKCYNFQEYFALYLDKEEGEISRSSRDYGIRRRLFSRIMMIWSHRKAYSGIKKSMLFCMASFMYSFIPYRKKLWPVIFQIRKAVFGRPPYKYSHKNEDQ